MRELGSERKRSGASEQANGQPSGPVLQSLFLVILAHSVSGSFGTEADLFRAASRDHFWLFSSPPSKKPRLHHLYDATTPPPFRGVRPYHFGGGERCVITTFLHLLVYRCTTCVIHIHAFTALVSFLIRKIYSICFYAL